MGLKLNPTTGTWRQLGSADVIDELEFGYDHAELRFPAISSCTAVIAQTAHGICGVHLTTFDEEHEIAALIEHMQQFCHGDAMRIHLIGVLSMIGGGCPNGSPFKGVGAMTATLRDLLSGGRAPCWGVATPTMATDLRVSLNAGTLEAAVRPRSLPITSDDGWQRVSLHPL